jgi:hypothetical protein
VSTNSFGGIAISPLSRDGGDDRRLNTVIQASIIMGVVHHRLTCRLARRPPSTPPWNVAAGAVIAASMQVEWTSREATIGDICSRQPVTGAIT